MWFRRVFVIWSFALLICSFLFFVYYFISYRSEVFGNKARRLQPRAIFFFFSSDITQHINVWEMCNAIRWIIWSFNDFCIFTIILQNSFDFYHQLSTNLLYPCSGFFFFLDHRLTSSFLHLLIRFVFFSALDRL